MKYIDFEYDGRRLSDFDSVLGSTDGGGINTVAFGNQIDIATVDLPFMKKVKSVSSKYGEVLTATFDIFKNPCYGEKVYTQDETNAIYRWLNRSDFKKFTPIYEDANWGWVNYNATFNLSNIMVDNDIIGFELQMTTDAPFGYRPDEHYELKGINTETKMYVSDTSVEVGYQYPTVDITCNAAGDLVFHNSADADNDVIIKNCIAGEVLSFSGDSKNLKSNVAHATLYKDFNYKFPRIVNSIKMDGQDERTNAYTTSIDTDISLTYSPICKATIL